MPHTKLIFVRNGEPIYPPHLDGAVIGQSRQLELRPEWYDPARRIGAALQRQKLNVEQIHRAAMTRSSRTMSFLWLGFCTDVHIRPKIKEHPELNEMSLGCCEGQPKDKVFAAGSVVLKGLAQRGADYQYPGISASGVPGESTRTVVRRMADYLVGLRAQSTPPEVVVALSDQMALQSLLGFIEIGGFEPGRTVDNVDAHELQNARLRQPAIGYCTSSSLILEGTADDFSCRVECVGRSYN